MKVRITIETGEGRVILRLPNNPFQLEPEIARDLGMVLKIIAALGEKNLKAGRALGRTNILIELPVLDADHG